MTIDNNINDTATLVAPAPAPAPAPRSDAKRTTALVLGIIGTVFALLIPLLGFVLGGIALGVGLSDSNAREREGLPAAPAGWILGAVALVLAAFGFVFWFSVA